jgi:hypothetical protein
MVTPICVQASHVTQSRYQQPPTLRPLLVLAPCHTSSRRPLKLSPTVEVGITAPPQNPQRLQRQRQRTVNILAWHRWLLNWPLTSTGCDMRAHQSHRGRVPIAELGQTQCTHALCLVRL